MFKLTFLPFVGQNYEQIEFKILVLGESHHYDGDFNNIPNDLTQNVVSDYLKFKKTGVHHENWMRTFTRFSNIFNGYTLTNTETISFWESVAFYNFVQYPTHESRQSPSPMHFTNSIDAFNEVLKSLDPDFIIFWGHRLWNNFPKQNHKQEIYKGKTIHFLELVKTYPFKVIPHPASSQLTKLYSQDIKNYIELIKEYKTP